MTKFEWDEDKRLANIRKHGIDFVDMPAMFEGDTLSYEDTRFEYREYRLITIGRLRDFVVLVAHTETDDTIRIIHARKASKETARHYSEHFRN
ncbi:MAG: BrnT family toxin [Halothiobacillaceae bacterium]|jgi:uncharacterized DUF497 family protein|nr:BrnT family toxin [Halothiobacillaceae bacterium]MDY0050646.1 BrnT family toxin [Halothiobacillaceae bacterium]